MSNQTSYKDRDQHVEAGDTIIFTEEPRFEWVVASVSKDGCNPVSAFRKDVGNEWASRFSAEGIRVIEKGFVQQWDLVGFRNKHDDRHKNMYIVSSDAKGGEPRFELYPSKSEFKPDPLYANADELFIVDRPREQSKPYLEKMLQERIRKSRKVSAPEANDQRIEVGDIVAIVKDSKWDGYEFLVKEIDITLRNPVTVVLYPFRIYVSFRTKFSKIRLVRKRNPNQENNQKNTHMSNYVRQIIVKEINALEINKVTMSGDIELIRLGGKVSSYSLDSISVLEKHLSGTEGRLNQLKSFLQEMDKQKAKANLSEDSSTLINFQYVPGGRQVTLPVNFKGIVEIDGKKVFDNTDGGVHSLVDRLNDVYSDEIKRVDNLIDKMKSDSYPRAVEISLSETGKGIEVGPMEEVPVQTCVDISDEPKIPAEVLEEEKNDLGKNSDDLLKDYKEKNPNVVITDTVCEPFPEMNVGDKVTIGDDETVYTIHEVFESSPATYRLAKDGVPVTTAEFAIFDLKPVGDKKVSNPVDEFKDMLEEYEEWFSSEDSPVEFAGWQKIVDYIYVNRGVITAALSSIDGFEKQGIDVSKVGLKDYIDSQIQEDRAPFDTQLKKFDWVTVGYDDPRYYRISQIHKTTVGDLHKMFGKKGWFTRSVLKYVGESN